MTPLKAIEAIQAVQFVPATKYPTNVTCAHPECDKEGESDHHIFGRGKGENSDSYFVLVPVGGDHGAGGLIYAKKPIPHVVRFCGHGTAGHHGAVEAHEAWIKYEDGVFVWYERVAIPGSMSAGDPPSEEWVRVGPLDPQPFNWGEKRRKPRKRKKGEERAKRDRITIGVPTGFADGGAVWDDLFGDGKDERPMGRVRERLGRLREEEGGIDRRPPFELIVDMANDWLNS